MTIKRLSNIFLICLIKKRSINRDLFTVWVTQFYSLSDPRANVFKSFVESLSKEKGREDEFNLYSRVELTCSAGHRK